MYTNIGKDIVQTYTKNKYEEMNKKYLYKKIYIDSRHNFIYFDCIHESYDEKYQCHSTTMTIQHYTHIIHHIYYILYSI